MTQWHYSRNGQENGPVSSSELKQLAARGQLQPTDTVWREGLKGWIPASKVNGLFAGSVSNPQRGGSDSSDTPEEPSRITQEEPLEQLANIIANDSVTTSSAIPAKDLVDFPQRTLWVGVLALFAAIWIGWYAFIRDPWESNHGVEVVRLSAETVSLVKAIRPAEEGVDSEIAAVSKYEELLAYVGDRQISDVAATKAMAEAREIAEPVRKKLSDKRRVSEQEKKAEAERAIAEKQLASLSVPVQGGAWLTKRSGSSEPIRGLRLYFIPRMATSSQELAVLQAIAIEIKNGIDRNKKSIEKLTEILKKPPRLEDKAVDDLIRGQLEMKTVLVEQSEKLLENLNRHSDAVLKSPAQSVLDIKSLFNLSLHPLKDEETAFSIAWDAFVLRDAVASTHTNVDGKYSVQIPGGRYYTYAKYESDRSVVEWIIPVEATDSKGISIDFHNETAISIENKDE